MAELPRLPDQLRDHRDYVANHHNIFKYIARTDHYLVLINTLLLLCIGFAPFPTALLAEYLGHPGERTAVLVYSGWFLVTAIVYNVLWRYASHQLLASRAQRCWKS